MIIARRAFILRTVICKAICEKGNPHLGAPTTRSSNIKGNAGRPTAASLSRTASERLKIFTRGAQRRQRGPPSITSHRESPAHCRGSMAKARRKVPAGNYCSNARQLHRNNDSNREFQRMLHQKLGGRRHGRRNLANLADSNRVTFLSGANFVRCSHETGRLPRHRCYSKNDLFIGCYSVSRCFRARSNGTNPAPILTRGASQRIHTGIKVPRTG